MKKIRIYFEKYSGDVYETESEHLNVRSAIEEFLEFEYHNSDGWEWMTKSADNDIIIVEDDTGNKKEYLFSIDYSPEFNVYEAEYEN